MLDLFGNVFGRSKKSVSGSNQASTSKQEAATTDEDFVVVPGQGNPSENTLYPYIDFSELSVNGEAAAAAAAAATSAKRKLDDNHLSPLENVPFTCNVNLPGQKMSVELKPYFETIEKIDLFLSAPSMSDYNFSLEKSFLNEYQ